MMKENSTNKITKYWYLHVHLHLIPIKIFTCKHQTLISEFVKLKVRSIKFLVYEQTWVLEKDQNWSTTEQSIKKV